MTKQTYSNGVGYPATRPASGLDYPPEAMRQANAAGDRLAVRVDELEAVLRELVDLKDGPRDEDYERRKPAAWERARELLAAAR